MAIGDSIAMRLSVARSGEIRKSPRSLVRRPRLRTGRRHPARPRHVRSPARNPADQGFEECPTCGGCYESGTGRCPTDGASLAAVAVPRLLGGRYQLERRLGRGGMGTVYAAFDSSLDRRVAAKIIRDDLIGLPGAAERFQHEARVAAAFSHPNVVTVHDFGVAGAHAFLVMELLTAARCARRCGRSAASIRGGRCSSCATSPRRSRPLIGSS